MGVAVALQIEHGLAGIVLDDRRFQPNLARAAENLVRAIVRFVRQRVERTTEFDQITVTVFPMVEEGEVVENFIRFIANRTT